MGPHPPPITRTYSPLGSFPPHTRGRKVVATPDTSATAGKFDFSGFSNGQLWVALITFLYGELVAGLGDAVILAGTGL